MKSLALLVLLGGCFLPVATGAPEPATTVGKGRIGAMASGEAPTVDLIAKNSGSDYLNSYGESPSAALRFTLSYGLTEDTDLEVAAEGQLWFFFLPLPTGGSIGLRQHLLATDMFDIAIAGRIGGVSSGGTTTDNATGYSRTDDASAVYGAVQGVVQTRRGVVRPLLAVNVMPFKITRGLEGEPISHFKGLASSATFGLMLVGDRVQVGPYAAVTNFESELFPGRWIGSGGLMLAIRPDRNRPVIASPPPPPPGYYGPPPPGYYGPPPPMAPPPAPPPGAPAPEAPPGAPGM